MTDSSFNIIDRYLIKSKIVMKFDPLKPDAFQYNLDKLSDNQSVADKYAETCCSANVIIADLQKDMCIDMHMSSGCKIAIALHWLGLLNSDVDVLVISAPEWIASSAWRDSDFTALIAYDCSDKGVLCHSLIPKKSFLIGKDAFHSYVKWNGPVTAELESVLSRSARINAAHNLKTALTGINNMLSDPDYSTAMKGDTLPKCAAALSMLSFGDWTLEYNGFSCEGLPTRCDPPDDFHDDLAEHMSESAEKLDALLNIWKHYAESSPIKFSFPFEMVMNRPQAIKDVAGTIGIEDAVKAYLSGVPLADVLA